MLEPVPSTGTTLQGYPAGPLRRTLTGSTESVSTFIANLGNGNYTLQVTVVNTTDSTSLVYVFNVYRRGKGDVETGPAGPSGRTALAPAG